MSALFYLRITGGIILLAMNAFFVATEFALTRLRQYSKDDLSDTPGIQRAWKMTEKLEIYLTSCQIGITTTSILLGVIAEPAVTELILWMIPVDSIGGITSHSISIVLSISLINLIHTIWGEQAPTYVGVERAQSVARYFSLPLYWWTKLIYPFLYVGDYITKLTLKIFGIEMSRSWMDAEETKEANDSGITSAAASTSAMKSEMVNLLKSGGVPADRREEVLQALEIQDIPVSEIMIPRENIVALSTEKSFEENHRVIKTHMRSRYPLIGETIDDFKGIIYTPQLMAHAQELMDGEKILDDYDWEKMTVDSNLPVSKLIDRFQEEHQELAMVMKQGRVTGLVTLTDAFEKIIGSAEDPLDLME